MQNSQNPLNKEAIQLNYNRKKIPQNFRMGNDWNKERGKSENNTM